MAKRPAWRPQIEAGLEIPPSVLKEFDHRGTDEETTVLIETFHEIDGCWLLMEVWMTSYVRAVAWVIPKRIVNGRSPDAIVSWLRQYVEINDPYTVGGENGEYLYINHDFRKEE